MASDSAPLTTSTNQDSYNGISSTAVSSRPSTGSPSSATAPAGGRSNIRHQRFVLSDVVAFSYLEEDPSTTVLTRNQRLEGYQLYIVEQWACSRSHPTFVVAAFTGDPTHTIKVNVISVPADEESWSPRLRVYFKTLSQYYARRKDTPLGVLMVTNLSTFPSSLTIVLIPDGDLRKHREDFFVSEDLKRLGCSGRVGLSISPPSLPTQVKFHQVYRVSDRIDFYSSVIELVKLCQVALLLFGCLGPEYADGLLCDVTERAVNDWWLRIGTDLYNIDPSDGILGHTTVAGLLGTLIGARNRLSVLGAPISKDVFDVESSKRAISYFQKTQRLHRSRRLDRTTLDKLHQATAKQASGGSSWMVPKALKSTVADLSGKGGEMVMEMVGKADKASIADVETVDIDRFSHFVKGDRARWLWHGKSRKRTTRDLFADAPIIKRPGAPRPNQTNGSHDDGVIADPELPPEEQRQPTALPQRDDDSARPSIDMAPLYAAGDPKTKAFQRATGRLRDAVGMRGHERNSKSKDFNSVYHTNNKSAESMETPLSGFLSPVSALDSGMVSSEPQDKEPSDHSQSSTFTSSLTETPVDSQANLAQYDSDQQTELGAAFEYTDNDDTDMTKPSTRNDSVVSDFTRSLDEALPYSEDDRRAHHISRYLRRTQSSTPAEQHRPAPHDAAFWPRQLSFSLAEESLHGNPALADARTDADDALTRQVSSPKGALQTELLAAERARQLRARIASLDAGSAHWAAGRVAAVEELQTTASQDLEQLHSLYYPRREEYAALQEGSREIVAEERARLLGGVRDVETLGQKLEYEISALKGKVEDVEDAVQEFERRVVYTEGRVGDLTGWAEGRAARQGWGSWVVKMIFGNQRGTVGAGGRGGIEVQVEKE